MNAPILTAFLLWVSWSVHAELTVSPLFTDHAVLQRGVLLPVTGRGVPGAEVTVEFAGQSKTSVVSADGSWRTSLEPLALSSQPAAMTVTSTEGTRRVFEDLLVGDVWFAAGQSNMGFAFNASLKPTEPFDAERNSLIRFMSVKPEFYPIPRESFSEPNQWTVATQASIQWLSAPAWFFAQEIRKEVDVPIGLIVVARGGTMIQPFMPIESHRDLEGTERFSPLAKLKEALGSRDPATEAGRQAIKERLDRVRRWNDALPASVQRGSFPSPMPSLAEAGQENDCGIYNACIHPFRDVPIKGMIWYQGESNGGDGEMYAYLLKAFIVSLRGKLNGGDLPVYVVQLAPYGPDTQVPGAGDGSSGVREAQREVCRDLEKTGLVVTLDIGDPRDIHPKNKVDVGKRLARWALNRDYGFKNILPSGPQLREHLVEDERIILHFDSIGGGLMAGRKNGLGDVEPTNAPITTFAVAGDDKVFVRADAEIKGNTVVLSSAQVSHPRHVRYAYSASPAGPYLYNQEGLPASAFKTDPW